MRELRGRYLFHIPTATQSLQKHTRLHGNLLGASAAKLAPLVTKAVHTHTHTHTRLLNCPDGKAARPGAGGDAYQTPREPSVGQIHKATLCRLGQRP